MKVQSKELVKGLLIASNWAIRGAMSGKYEMLGVGLIFLDFTQSAGL